MAKNKNLLVWIVLIVAIVALILSIVAIGKSNVSGNSIFDVFKRDSVKNSVQESSPTQMENSRGLLADVYLSSGKSAEDLKGYKVEYDQDGNLVSETKFIRNSNTSIISKESKLFVPDGSITCSSSCNAGCSPSGCDPETYYGGGSSCSDCTCLGSECSNSVCKTCSKSSTKTTGGSAN